MMDMFRNLSAALLLTLLLSPAALADEAQDKQVDIGVKAYDDGDYQRAKAILLPLAEAGNAQVMHIIGRLYDGTDVFPTNPKTECDWYERAANKGLAKSMYNMSICFDGLGRPNDPEISKAWMLKSAEQGYIPAMINLASLDPSEGDEFRSWMMMAQDHGSVFAKVDLWLQGYKDDSQMNLQDFICVSWRILIMDGDILDCD